MKKVAPFGNAAGGKSTLASRLAGVTGLPLYPLDRIQYAEPGIVRPLVMVMSNSRTTVVTLLRSEFAEEVASGFARLGRIPQTDIIWFLDYFVSLSGAESEALLDALADSAAMAFGPPSRPTLNDRGTVDAPPGLAHMCEARNRPGAKGGTRYMDVKMLGADPALREPGGYHPSWREQFTPLHFQPRPDLLADLSEMKAAKAPLMRKLVNTALTKSLGLRKETLAGGVNKFIGRCGDCELTVHVDFGGMLSQLGYTVTLKSTAGQPLASLLSYERLWGTGGRWDYLTEENAPRCITFFAEQLTYLADLTQRLLAEPGAAPDRRGM